MTTAPDDPLPLPLPDPEPRGQQHVRCRDCGRRLRHAGMWGLGPECLRKRDERTAPRPPANTVEQETLPGV